MSKSQIERLGIRLVSSPDPSPEDVTALHELLAAYGEVLADAADRVRIQLGVAPTARVKNTGTILEKLHRQGGSWLKSIQDLAGMRIVGEFNRSGQDALTAAVIKLFGDEPRPPKIVDRRKEPVRGYRAVHVIVFPEGVPIEVQVRTRLQHEWAEIFEKLADLVGRDIRYGGEPTHWLSKTERNSLAAPVAEVYELTYRLRQANVARALSISELIDAVERAEQEAPHAPELVRWREETSQMIVSLRLALEGMGHEGHRRPGQDTA